MLKRIDRADIRRCGEEGRGERSEEEEARRMETGMKEKMYVGEVIIARECEFGKIL